MLIVLYTPKLRPQRQSKASKNWYDTEAFKKDHAFARDKATALWTHYSTHCRDPKKFYENAIEIEEEMAAQIEDIQCNKTFQNDLKQGFLSTDIFVEPLCLCSRHEIDYKKATGLFQFALKPSSTPSPRKKEEEKAVGNVDSSTEEKKEHDSEGEGGSA